MELSYKRTFKESYMIIESEMENYGYEERMLKENELKTLLAFYTLQVNGKIQFWYDISSKQSIKDYLDQNSLSYELLLDLFAHMMVAFSEVAKFLLSSRHIILSCETIYISRQKPYEIYLCYCPAIEEESGLTDLMEYILQVLDHENEELTKLCYTLYEITLDEHSTISDLYEYIRENMIGELHNELIEDDKIVYEREEDELQETYNYMEEEELDQDIQSSFDTVSMLEKIRQKGLEIIEMIKGWTKNKNEQIVQKEDLVIDPEPVECNPTVFLGSKSQKCCGNLRYIGSEAESDYVISGNIFRIGTHGANDACLTSQTVSRHHAKINEINSRYYLEDLNSTNGTFLNDMMLNYNERYELNPGDRIRFADVPYIFS
ncbi:MAG: FHA domain-containing protein [Lachnospiraceae bacterium]|nr:FHA domain-containing protein [Lachnospiraceae bacterium]